MSTACRKLSVKVIIGATPNKGMLVDDKGKEIPTLDLLAVYGVASSAKKVETGFGQSTAILGEITAVNLKSGEEFTSPKMFAPPVLAEVLEQALVRADINGVKFGYIIGIKPDAKGSMGYQYYLKELVKLAESNPMAELRSTMAGLIKLPAKK